MKVLQIIYFVKGDETYTVHYTNTLFIFNDDGLKKAQECCEELDKIDTDYSHGIRETGIWEG